MAILNRDARGFVEGIVSYIKKDGKSTPAEEKVRKYLSKVSDTDQKRSIARVESAVSLDTAERDRLERLVHAVTGKNIRAEYFVKPSLLGGVRITIGEWVLDTTLSGQLNRMKESLL